jgi:sugar phosphate isomerase/epimerase
MITVMRVLPGDMAATLSGIAQAGYRVVETIGTQGVDPAVLAGRLAVAGLATNSQHLFPRSFYPVMDAWSKGVLATSAVAAQFDSVLALERLPAVLDEGIAAAKVLGQRYLIWPTIPASALADRAGLERLIRAFTQAGEICAREGLVFGLHNGSKSFLMVGGKRIFDAIAEETDPAKVKMELDVYWATRMGIDPVAYLHQHGDRIALCHLKDMNDKGEIVLPGTGTMDFRAIVTAAKAVAVADFYVEYDEAPNPMRDIVKAYAYLAPILQTDR